MSTVRVFYPGSSSIFTPSTDIVITVVIDDVTFLFVTS